MDLRSAHEALKQYFGYDSFRPNQAEIIESVLADQDCLVIMPTGGGKSICYQIPALIRPGMAVVISPLIALMKDQVEGLKANGIRAAYLNSSQSSSEQAELTEAILLSEIQLLYVSPEKALSADFFSLISRVKLNLIAVDEAHCISAWGHDFRPEYTQLAHLKQRFPEVPMMALTATADKATRQDITQQLDLRNPQQVVASFDRPNLSMTVLPGRKRMATILDFIKLRPNQSGIIYCLSRKATQQVSDSLQSAGIPAAFYHAGMTAKARSRVQEQFIRDEVPIICATIAFGMGIDKSNVRWVIHYNMPKNLESYYQEIGRAGRDGLPSDTVMFFSFRDVVTYRDFIGDSGQAELQLAKLERIQQFAQAQTCRRRILLSYFGEHQGRNCGNCDVCKNPPQRIDGTVLAQKALSALVRLKEDVGMTLLIDILRGSRRKEILEKGYQHIKTYGAGSDMSVSDWQFVMLQLLDQGLIEIAYDQGSTLKLSSLSQEVLFEGRRVQMVQPSVMRERQDQQRESNRPKLTKGQQFQVDVFEELRKVRRTISDREKLPPYQVFSDATLQQMAEHLPLLPEEMHDISGVGKVKFQRYGDIFMEELLRIIREREEKNAYMLPGTTTQVTFAFLQARAEIQHICETRRIKEGTVYQHIGQLYEEGYPIELSLYLPDEIKSRIREAVDVLGKTDGLRPLYEHMNGEVPYHLIRLGIAWLEVGEAV